MQTFSKESQLGKKKNNTAKWRRTRNRWLRENPPDYKGYYYCEITPCLLPGVPMTRQEMSLDHIIKKGAHPEYKYILSNLRPSHSVCNMAREQ